MAPGEILINIIIPIASIAATALGAFVVKKRRDKKKAVRIASDIASMQYVEAQIQSAVDDLRVEIDCATTRVDECITEESVDGKIRKSNDYLRLQIAEWDGDKSSKGEMERHVHDGCTRLRAEFNTALVDATNCLRSNLEKQIAADSEAVKNVAHSWDEKRDRALRDTIADAVKKIAHDAEEENEDDITDIRKLINKKIQEYDIAITKWIGKKLEGYQPTLQGAFAAKQHDVKEDDVDDEIGHDTEIDL